MRPTIRACIALTLFLAISGCGYTVANSHLSEEYRTIAVPAFKNESFEQEIQIRVNNALVRELQADGRFRVVDDPAYADLVLTGAITGFEAQAISYSTDDNIGQFKVTLFARAALEDTKTGEIIWQKKGIQGQDFYQTLGGRTREEGLDEATEELVENIIYECFDNYW